MIEKSVEFRNNIRDISRRRRRSTTEEDNSKKLLLEQCDDYRLQMKYLGVEIKVLYRSDIPTSHFDEKPFLCRIDIKVQHGHLKNKESKRYIFLLLFHTYREKILLVLDKKFVFFLSIKNQK